MNEFNPEIKKLNEKKNYYIWHCPNLDCKTKGIVLFKTTSPFIGDGKIECKNCKRVYDFKDIIKENKNNIYRYMNKICN